MLQSSYVLPPQYIPSHRFGPAYFSSGNYAYYRTKAPQWADSVARRIRRALSSKKHPRILDVGCAYGHLIAALQDKFGAEVAGLEYSSHAIAHAVASVRRHIQRGDMRRNPFPRMYRFDAVICLDVFQYLTEQEVPLVARNLSRWTSEYVFFSSVYRHSVWASQKRNPDTLRKTTLTQKAYIQYFRDVGMRCVGKFWGENGGDILVFTKARQ